MEWEKAQKTTARIVLSSLVTWINNLQTFSEEEKENLLNICFNVLINSFNPDMTEYFNETILNVSETSKISKEDILDIVYQQLNWEKEK